ncbi:protein big brother-like isoform X1 [Eriocheir sinensis]|uniref:protein big brother-like isoform X1 n=1 Tax=Eriocheir sinensis TaxID=95602 RepID=UPI0021C970CE|nr:protein big brother-like isoform X1 [Eriocheir sinensis]XP_050698081.1 protein big brother-like isoform X1 [Eriocheir sinensis]XP_050698082.1 protein big brother-like isoform X1 [Eriocheir sinensis]XP_050698083.1 protein big brother-like isoform X1 [Eriocheir sinensis]XP_050698084.1 protein big brother-like isoform X1 [Eriocheir sinensis]XP_050698086.1 protein big brother-like isoform X1 [Eriocheir sinensis]XP_050698087.1 protein big brother-like isoform X1 [Eriocheir sinensis]XP_05069808
MMMNEPVPVSTPLLGHYESPLPPLYEPPPACPPKPRLMFKMPRVVPDQKSKFESDELFRRLARETEQVRYTGFRDRPSEERRQKFQSQCRDGFTELAFVNTGTNLLLSFTPAPGGYSPDVDFNKEPGKVHIKSHFIMNGVCVRWRGYVDLERLDGVGCLEYDEDTARLEDALLREELDKYKAKLREFEDKQRSFKPFATASTAK